MLGLVGLAVAGCALGRVLGLRLGLCPYRLSGQLAAALPVLVGLVLLDGAARLQAVLVGGAAIVAVFLSGHGSRMRALAFCLVGAGLAALLGSRLG